MTKDSLQIEIIEGRMDCKWGRRRPRKKILDWMMSEEYSKLKEEAQHRGTWRTALLRTTEYALYKLRYTALLYNTALLVFRQYYMYTILLYTTGYTAHYTIFSHSSLYLYLGTAVRYILINTAMPVGLYMYSLHSTLLQWTIGLRARCPPASCCMPV